MAMDQELERHLETWHGFTRVLRWSVIGIVLLLIILALWLL
jgi:Bacterial aa3 type cytochrome c oxidase subunit IV